MKRIASIALPLAVALGLGWYFLHKKHPVATAPAVAESSSARPHPSAEGESTAGPSSGGGESRVLADDDKPGTLQLEGQVIDAEDRPVGGAHVTITTMPPRVVVSEKDGSFAFDKLVARSYTLLARTDTGSAGPVVTRLTAKSEPVTLRLKPAASVEVTVISSRDRKPLAGASVELRGLETISAVTDDKGKAVITSMAPGPWSVVAWAPGFAKSFSQMRMPRVAGATPLVQKVGLELRQGALVTGHVVDSDGKAIPNAQIAYEGVADRSERADARRDGVTSDENGAFKFDALPSGSFRFTARDDNHAPGASSTVVLDGESEKSGVDITLDVGAVLAGRVVDKDNQPVAGASVRVAVRGERGGRGGGGPGGPGGGGRGGFGGDVRQTSTDDRGNFELRGLPRKAVETVAESETAASEINRTDLSTRAEFRDLTITLDVDGMIAGTVVDTENQPVAGAEVMAMPDLEAGGPGDDQGGGRGRRRGARQDLALRGFSQALTDTGGHFELRGVVPGEYTLRASLTSGFGLFGRNNNSAEDGTPAKVGDQNIKIVLPRNGGVRGKVVLDDGTQITDMFTVNAGPGGVTPFTGTSGSFEVGDIPPGVIALEISSAAFEHTQVPAVTVAADKTTDVGTITVTKGRTISGHLTDGNNTPIPNANVYAARRLAGDGSRPTGGAGGFGGGNGNNRTTTSDNQGMYVFSGVGPTDLVVMAETDVARSPAVLVPGSKTSTTANLQLLPLASLSGTVTQNGQKMDRVTVSAASQTVPSATFSVQTASDGTYHIDRLAPDTYRVSALGGRSPRNGMAFHSQVVALTPGQAGVVDISFTVTEGSLDVTPVAKSGTVSFTAVYAATAPLTAPNAKALQAEVGMLPPGSSYFSISIAGGPAHIANVTPGTYTVCATPFPLELTSAGALRDYTDRAGTTLAVFCTQATVTDQPDQAVSVPVTVPAFVPPS